MEKRELNKGKTGVAGKYRKWSSQCRVNKVFDVVNHVVLFFVLIVTAYPLYYVVIMSFSKNVVGTYLLPNGFTLDGYKEVLRYSEFWLGYANTILYTVGGVMISVSCTLMFAYAISRSYFPIRKFLLLLIMIPMFIGGGLVPTYLTVSRLGLVDTRFYIMIVGIANTYNIIVARTFFNTTIPAELYEASILDGCGDGTFFSRIVIPLSKPIIAVEVLYSGVARWNSYMTELVYLRDKRKYPLSIILKQILWSVETIKGKLLGESDVDGVILTEEMMELLQQKVDIASVMQYCIIIISCLPLMLVYPYLQKYFAKGVMIGSVKG